MLGLPSKITTCLFDLDGVLTDTASVHGAAWQEMFDEFLQARAQRDGAPYVPFDPVHDYEAYVDGKPRLDGVRDLLAARGIVLPEGTDQDAPTAETVNGLGSRKNAMVLRRIHEDGVTVFDGSRRYLVAAERAGLRRAVVSSSANAGEVLAVTGLAALVEVRVDGVTISAEHLAGKPAPDTFLAAAARLGSEPGECAVFEDALAGVAAGRAGRFGYVVGVDRVGQAQQLRSHGADVVVTDLAELVEAA
ncbi:beta-phosphoglucomutase family hydrolase [Sanguibacter antarcticus]|uniref:Beta-phosphoglucomutase n=1 Tax=Sanguibacter antarcticus TaxID=372484 RepID=A0A2A9E7K2_9MICO|nr:beta-phosphoglucomutase family hydrolase [Sanguibacter antarcticus]PFG34541.1 HAD superfamily hydrolase (TIGR01509 family)/beta-phosphoglucomutase family hydrolase [Sanguibacter antarcticus]